MQEDALDIEYTDALDIEYTDNCLNSSIKFVTPSNIYLCNFLISEKKYICPMHHAKLV